MMSAQWRLGKKEMGLWVIGEKEHADRGTGREVGKLRRSIKRMRERLLCYTRRGKKHGQDIRKDCFQVKSNLLTDSRFTTHMNIMILN